MSYDFSDLKQKVNDTEGWLKKEYFSIRTGRATPSVLDALRVDSYGVMVPIHQVATVSVQDARTLRILPYDATAGKAIEKVITDSELGLSVSLDDKGVRVSFPLLTNENRTALAKVVKNKCEQAHITLRSERDVVWNDIQNEEKEGPMGEDDKFRYKEEMEKIVSDAKDSLDALLHKKEQEILNI